METWRQTNFFNLLPARAVSRVAADRFPIAPQQLWSLLTVTQQQQVLQTLTQIGLELSEIPKPEVCDECA